MSCTLLILRPEPGASATAARAAAIGFATATTPLFEVRGVAWTPPEAAQFDALMLTSANAARHAGARLADYRRLPLYAVGEASAAAARAAGFPRIVVGDADGAALLARAAGDGVRRLLHLAGRDHRRLDIPNVIVERRIVYAAEPIVRLPEAAAAALGGGAVALLHSPRAAHLFRALVEQAGLAPAALRLAAISPAALAAAGSGWAAAAAAERPADDALLAVAAGLCD